MKEEEKVFCKQLYYKFPDKEKHTILLGIVEKEDDSFIYFRTRNRRYQFNKSLILQITETKELFEEQSEEGENYEREY